MRTLAIVTRHPEAIEAYLGFGWKITETGKNRFGDHVVIAEGPDEHTDWQQMRLGSGMHGAWNADNLDAWKEEWGYESDQESGEAIHDEASS